jgi:cytochrome c oxidase subunit II
VNDQGAKKLKIKKVATAVVLVAVAAVFFGCSESGIQSALNPKSTQASQVAILWWVMLAAFTAVLLIVTLLVAIAVLRRGEGNGLTERQKWGMVIAGGIVAPLVVTIGLVVYSTLVGRYTANVPETAPVTIEITGYQWWWDVRYTAHGRGLNARTANEIHIPVGVPVRFILRSHDVIHSFWMPNFQGKTDLIPGRINYTWVTATEAGVFRGQCAEFCGLQHAKMSFTVVASPAEEFYAWLAHQAQPARPPETPEQFRGQQVFLTSCVMCHAVRGTPALAAVAPDLTHFGSRRTIAAGTLPNTRGHLSGWIADPQQIKPGNRMPRLYLSNEELDAVTLYLESLK